MNAPDPATTAASRIVLLADCEGALDRVTLALRAGGIIDAGGAWIASPGTTLVQLGDAIDRGPRSIAVHELLASLAARAERAGGAVIPVLGNHELFAFAAGSGDVDGMTMWALNGGLTVIEEATALGVFGRDAGLAEALDAYGGVDAIKLGAQIGDRRAYDLVAACAALLWGGSRERFSSTRAPRGELESADAETLMPADVLGAYVKRAVPFAVIDDMLFVHGGATGWLARHVEHYGSLAELARVLGEDLRDPLVRTRSTLARSFTNDASPSRGGRVMPAGASPAWLDFEEQRAAFRDVALLELLRAEGIRSIFAGHTPAARPRVMRVDASGRTFSVSGPSGPTREPSGSAAYAAYCLDCGLRRDRQDRPHLFEIDRARGVLRWLADDTELALPS